jgi:hypothetical protein
MRKILLFLYIFCGVLTFSEAQIQKGVYTLRPNLSIDRDPNYLSAFISNEKAINLAADMNYGKFVTDNLLLSGGFGGFYNQEDDYYVNSASIGGQCYYWQDAKIKPYVSSTVTLSKLVYSSFSTVSNLPIKTRNNEYKASLVMGAQYFFNENIALDLRFIFNASEEKITPNPSGFQPEPIFQQSYTLDLQPFYSIATYNSAKEVKDFFYKGKTQISGSVNFTPKPFGTILGFDNEPIFSLSVGTTYFLHKFFGLGAHVGINDFDGFERTLAIGLRAESNIKIFKRFYLSPNVTYDNQNLDGIVLGIGKVSYASANLQAKFFMNKYTAFTVNFFSFPIYSSNADLLLRDKLFFKSGFAYYLK